MNPSLELTVNTFGIVIEAEALNDDGAVVLGAVDMLNRPYGDVIGALLSSDAFGSYAEKDAFIDVNVVSENNRLGESLVAQSDEALSSASCEHALVAVPIAPLAMRQLQRVWALVAIRLPKS